MEFTREEILEMKISTRSYVLSDILPRIGETEAARYAEYRQIRYFVEKTIGLSLKAIRLCIEYQWLRYEDILTM